MASNIYNLGNIDTIEKPVVLFNQNATSTTTTYNLLDDLSKYKFLIAYTSVNNGTDVYSNKDSVFIDVASMQHCDNEYRVYVNSPSAGYHTVSFYFPTNTTLKLNSTSTTVSNWSGTRLHRIVGIK